MIYGGGTNVFLADPNTVDVAVSAESNAAQSPTPTPTATLTPVPTPDKFGAPSVIASSNPYVITSGTTITTDPSITTNGVTDYGKIYRGSTDDGAFSQWAFGSTSAFDTALNIDTEFFTDPAHLPIAVFKFQGLSLIGNPTISTSNGGVTNLGLIGVDGITSDPPGGTLTFSGINLLALATVNGSINLTSDLSFQNLNTLAIYARGAASDLTLNSSLSNIGALKLAAERSIQITNAGTLSVGGFDATTGGGNLAVLVGALSLNGEGRFNVGVLPGTTIANGANIIFSVSNDLTNNSTTDFSRLRVINEGHIQNGGNIALIIGGNLTTTGTGGGTGEFQIGDVALVLQNTNAQIDNGGNLVLTVTGNVHINGLSALLQNYDFSTNPGGHIGTGGNIAIEIGGNLTAAYVDTFVNNRNGGTIGSGENLAFNVNGALTTTGDAGFLVSTRYDTAGSTIGSDVTIQVNANSVNIGGSLAGTFLNPGSPFSGISNRGSVIDGNAIYEWDVTNAMTLGGAASLMLLNDGGTSAVTPVGGTIHGSVLFQVTAGSFSAAGIVDPTTTPPSAVPALDVELNNKNGGIIDQDATINFNISGDIITYNSAGAPGDAIFTITNLQNSSSNGLNGGSIGTAATINIAAANISIANDFDVEILNGCNGNAPGPKGGSIGPDASLIITSNALSCGVKLNASIDNSDNDIATGMGGSIGGNAAINVNTGNLSGDLFASVNNGTGSIASNATVNVTATSISAGAGGIDLSISDRNAGSIGGSATVNLNVNGSVTSGVGGFFVGDTFGNDGGGGGTTGLDAVVSMNAGSAATSGFFEAYNNINGGAHIHGDAINTVIVTGDLTAQQGMLVTLEDTGFTSSGTFGGSSHIDGNALLTLSAQNITTPSTLTGVPGTDTMALEASIYPNVAGVVGGDAIINVFATQNISAPGETVFWVANGNYQNLGPGNIGGNTEVNVAAANISTGDLLLQILDYVDRQSADMPKLTL